MIYTIKRFSDTPKNFSFTSKLKAGLKSAWTGANIGAIATPGNIILALCGKKKASLIMTGIGAGIGAGIGFYYGWKGQKELEEYNNKIETDPKFKKEERDKLDKYIKNALGKKYNYPIIKNPKLPVKPDFYKYYNLYAEFREKYYNRWVKAWDNLDSIRKIDIDFSIVFPTPSNEDYLGKMDLSDGPIMANYDSPSDHYWILWDPKKKEYNNDLGSGRGTGKTLLEASQNFAAQWIVEERKIKDPKILKVAKIHNNIIREFLKLQ